MTRGERRTSCGARISTCSSAARRAGSQGFIIVLRDNWSGGRRARASQQRRVPEQGRSLKRFVVGVVAVIAAAASVETAQNAPARRRRRNGQQQARGRGQRRWTPRRRTVGFAGRPRCAHPRNSDQGLDHRPGRHFFRAAACWSRSSPGRLRVTETARSIRRRLVRCRRCWRRGSGLLDVSLSAVATNHLIYLTYSKRARQGNAATAGVSRAMGRRLDARRRKDVLVARHAGADGTDQSTGPASGSYGSRLAWDETACSTCRLAIATTGEIAGLDRISERSCVSRTTAPCRRTIRCRQAAGCGNHRSASQSARPRIQSVNGELWSTEEVRKAATNFNLIKAGRTTAGRVSLGRNYDSGIVGEGFRRRGWKACRVLGSRDCDLQFVLL